MDRSNLEKMGRELKCPICLSLLNAAVSLTCNHLFCNSCIVKSIKSCSNCPVCKIPFHRREVRAAPHMDNLVNVYKSMEAASGFSIFVTQNSPSDGDKQCLDDHSPVVDTANGNSCNEAREKVKRKRDGSRKAAENISGSDSAKPSFPAKKRVQVPQNVVSETPTLHQDNEVGLVENEKHNSKDCSSTLENKSTFNENGQSGLLPFFWLREEDHDDDGADKSSQHSDKIHSEDGPMPDVPSFSDIKDSDDERSSSPTAEMHGTGNGAACFDSEMFEWTQRACSPELCSSPTKMQVPDSEENEGYQENESKEPLLDSNTNEEQNVACATTEKAEQETVVSDMALPDVSYPKTKESSGQRGSKKSNKGRRKALKAVIKKSAKESKDQMTENCVDLKEASESFMQVQDHDTSDMSLISKRITSRRKPVVSYSAAAGPTPDEGLAGFSGVQVPCQEKKDPITKLPSLLRRSQDKDEHLCLVMTRKSEKNSTEIEDCCLQSDKGKSTVCYNVQSQQKHAKFVMAQASLVMHKYNSKEIDSAENKSKSYGKRKSATKSNCNAVSRCKKKLKASPTCISKSESNHGVKDQDPSVFENNEFLNRTETEVQAKKNGPILGKSKLADAVILRKCQALPDNNKCAFCHSSQDSEELGGLVHYSNGKPVAANYTGETKVIHSHKICAEWAPNVYFEEGNAVNLEAELARSRRIKCSLCGLKGAALGCYEKSCRKSFHVPCAKSVSQCRWDMDNFVMLCPLHISSKLPSENVLHEQGTKNSVINGKSRAQRVKLPNKHYNIREQIWNSRGPSDKLIICCSALSAAEKETISEFEKLSGARVLKSFNSSVTHVIASTDENGACRRTLKFLMGILNGKWILSTEWVKACIKARERVNEEQYEITNDIHGTIGGPRLGRLRLINKEPKLFNGCKFYLMGDFVPSYKGYLQNLITAAGGTVLQRKPICGNQEVQSSSVSKHPVFIVYGLELPDICDLSQTNTILAHRQSNAEALARSSGAKVASNTWILNSIAACRLQVL